MQAEAGRHMRGPRAERLAAGLPDQPVRRGQAVVDQVIHATDPRHQRVRHAPRRATGQATGRLNLYVVGVAHLAASGSEFPHNPAVFAAPDLRERHEPSSLDTSRT